MKKVLFKDRKKGGIYVYKAHNEEKGEIFQYPGKSKDSIAYSERYASIINFYSIWTWSSYNEQEGHDFYEASPEQIELYVKADRGRHKLLPIPEQETDYSLY